MISLFPQPVQSFSLADTPSLDAFGRLRISEPNTLFESVNEYGLDTRVGFDATANGTIAAISSNASVTNGSNAVGPMNTNTKMVPITVSTSLNHYALLQSRVYNYYVRGKSHLVFISGVFAAGAGYTANIVLRSSTSGSVAERRFSQSNWNIDKFDGTGPSGITLDFTKTQIIVIQAQWLGVGRVVVGFDIDGRICPAHEFLNANVLSVPYTQSFNLPVRHEARNIGVSEMVSRAGYFDANNGVFFEISHPAAGGTVYFNCCAVMSEGGAEPRGFYRTINTGLTPVAVTTRRPLISIRPKATFNGFTNRSHIDPTRFSFRATTNDALVEAVIVPSLTGAAWTSVSAFSPVEYDVSATAISGGSIVVSEFANSGTGASALGVDLNIDTRSPMAIRQIDALTPTQDILSLVATSFSGTSNISAIINWYESLV